MKQKLKDKLLNGRFENLTPARSRAMAAVRGQGNKTTEARLKMALVRHGLQGWTSHPKEIVGRPDFLFADARVAVFVDGCFWHGCPKCGHLPRTNATFWSTKLGDNRTRDKQVSQFLRSERYLVLRLWEHELKSDLDGCLRKIISAITN